MPPYPPDPDRRPQHAGDAYRPASGYARWETTTGRHRRPESLADDNRLPSPYRRFTDSRFAHAPVFDDPRPISGTAPIHVSHRQYDGFIERGFAADGVRGFATDGKRGFAADDAPPPSRAEIRGAEAVRMAARRGRHAATDLAITVRAAPPDPRVHRDGRPVIGSHRAPGTLPIENWLLMSKGRQQALLAGLVAAGLALVMIPIQRGAGDVNPINAADRSVVGDQGGQQERAKPPAKNGSGRTAPEPARTDPAPAPTATSRPDPEESVPAEPPLPAVPAGTGPARSLKVTGTESIALTFDDGPDPVETPKILALLAEHKVTATFCLIGRNVQKHPEIVRQIVAAGHTLCNHTWSHDLTIGKESADRIQSDLDRTNVAIRTAVPGAEIPFFRAPGGNFTDRLVGTAYQEGMTSLYWQVDPRDWDHSTDEDPAAHTERVVESVQNTTKPGSIILSHDLNQPETIAAYEELLPWLSERFSIGLPVPPPVPASTPSASPSDT